MTAKGGPAVKRDDFQDFVLDQLDTLSDVTVRRMFGGAGLYCGDTFFAILYRGRLFFKIDEQTRGPYEARGMRPFQPNPKQTLKSYYEVPAEVLEDREMLVQWAHAAIRVQTD